eukprot:15340480-Ditylum_brightwellii.AAC.1
MKGDGDQCKENDLIGPLGCKYNDEEYRAPIGYILGGLRGWQQGERDQITSLGFNWVKKEMTSCGEDDRCMHVAYSQNGRFMCISDPNGQQSTVAENELEIGHYEKKGTITVLED